MSATPDTDEAVRGAQSSMAMDLHVYLGHTFDPTSENQGHGSWTEWWIALLEEARSLAHPENTGGPRVSLTDLQAMIEGWDERPPT